MDDGYSPVSILVLIGFILLEAVFYGFGSAIQNVNEGKLEDEAEEGNHKAARLLEIVNRPGRFVHTIQITTHLIGMITGAVILPIQVGALMRHVHILKPAVWPGTDMKPWFSNPMWWEQALFMIVVAMALLLIIISFGIIIPKRLAAKEPEKWGYHMLPVVLFAACIFLPLTKLITLVSALVLKLFGVDLADDDDNVTEEDIMSMVNEGHEQGVLEADETEMITNIFELGDKEASDIMTHRTNMTALDGSMTLGEAVHFILNEGINTRYPVYRDDIDDIVGILHMRDAMVYMESPRLKGESWKGMESPRLKDESWKGMESPQPDETDQPTYRDKPLLEIPGLLREANFIPETRSIDTLFKEMQSGKIHMEIVVDEYGQTAGLLTMEDILEEIVGNIMDEYDEEENFVTAREDGSYIMSGLTPLDDVMEILDIELPEEDSDTYDTLNGYLISRLDRIPQEGENPQVNFGRYTFEVIKAGNKMIESVRVFRHQEQEQNGNTDAEGSQADQLGKDMESLRSDQSGKRKESPRPDQSGKGMEEKDDRNHREHEGDVS